MKITKELLGRYRQGGGVRITLNFSVSGGFVMLNFTGFNGNDSKIIDERLGASDHQYRNLKNLVYGVISRDEKGTSLHDLIVNENDDLRDWLLKPVKYNDTDDRYVSYDMFAHTTWMTKLDFQSTSMIELATESTSVVRSIQSSSAVKFRLNPCPPC